MRIHPRRHFSRSTRLLAWVSVIAACLVGHGTALAYSTFNPSTIRGYVSREEIERAWGWDAARLRREARHIAFSSVVTRDVTYEVWCGHGARLPYVVHSVHRTKHRLASSTAYDAHSDARSSKHAQVAGFSLSGYLSMEQADSGNSIPAVGGACPAASDAGVITAVKLASTVSTIEIFASNAHADRRTTQIWIESAPTVH